MYTQSTFHRWCTARPFLLKGSNFAKFKLHTAVQLQKAFKRNFVVSDIAYFLYLDAGAEVLEIYPEIGSLQKLAFELGREDALLFLRSKNTP